jgi:hypothetical protein
MHATFKKYSYIGPQQGECGEHDKASKSKGAEGISNLPTWIMPDEQTCHCHTHTLNQVTLRRVYVRVFVGMRVKLM